MKKAIFIISIFLATFFTGQTQTKNFIDQPYIDVTGRADTSVIPNEIFIKIIITEKDTRDRISIEELENRMVDSLKTLGISTERDLVTSDLSSNFRYYFLKKKDVLKMKEYVLKVTDAVTATRVFILLEDLDISNTSIERVDHSELENIKSFARIKAIENAKLKAISLTKALGQNIGTAIYITDNETPDNLNNAMQGRASGILLRGNNSFAKFKEEIPKIEFEKIKVFSVVNVKFILK